jgi:transcriptional regulator with XRE-family HTH domain
MVRSKKMPAATKRAPFKKKEGPTEVDSYVGLRLRQRRTLLGMTQESLAQATGLTFQQIQKYEQGKNRVSASRLYQLCAILGITANYFFEGFGHGTAAALGLAEDQEHFEGVDVTSTKETIELMQTYYSISDVKVRKNILKLIKQMAENFRNQQGA